MSEFMSLLEEFEQLVEREKEKNTTTSNTSLSGAYQDAIRPSERQQFDTTTANIQQFDTTTANISVNGAHQDLALRAPKKGQFQWWQIWEMEESFQKNSYPNKLQRQLLSDRIRLPTFDIQLWFQNRRSQPKRVDDLILEIEKLQVEIERIKQAIRHIPCQNCGHGVVLDVTPSFVASSSLLGSEGRAGSFLEDSRSMEFVGRPRSHGKGDAWARPSDDRRGFQGSREMGFQGSRVGGFQGSREGGFLANRDFDRSSSRERW